MPVDLLIPSAKYIPKELQAIGKIPPILYPLGSGTVFDYIYSQYHHEVSSIKVVGFEGFSSLEKIISPKKYSGVTLVKISKLGDLAHTIYESLSDSDNDVIINFGDTIVDDEFSKLKGDAKRMINYTSNRGYQRNVL